MKTKIKPWNIKQLYNAMQSDLNSCQTDFERSMVKTICKKEIKEKANDFKKIRKLTPIEMAILETI